MDCLLRRSILSPAGPAFQIRSRVEAWSAAVFISGCAQTELVQIDVRHAAVGVAEDYCGSDNDSEVCLDFNAAVTSNTNPDGSVNQEALANQLLALLGN